MSDQGQPLNSMDDIPLYLPIKRNYFGGVRRQQGRGFLSGLGNLFRRILPFAQKYILPSAAEAVQGIASDIVSGDTPLKQSLKKRSAAALKGMARSYINQTGTGRRRRQKVKTSVVRRRRRRASTKVTKQKRGRRQQKVTSKKLQWNPRLIGGIGHNE